MVSRQTRSASLPHRIYPPNGFVLPAASSTSSRGTSVRALYSPSPAVSILSRCDEPAPSQNGTMRHSPDAGSESGISGDSSGRPCNDVHGSFNHSQQGCSCTPTAHRKTPSCRPFWLPRIRLPKFLRRNRGTAATPATSTQATPAQSPAPREPSTRSVIPPTRLGRLKLRLNVHVLSRLRTLLHLKSIRRLVPPKPKVKPRLPRMPRLRRRDTTTNPPPNGLNDNDDSRSHMTVLTRITSADYDSFGPVLPYRMRAAPRRWSL